MLYVTTAQIMILTDLYHSEVQQRGYRFDDGQNEIIRALDSLSQRLGANPHNKGRLGRLFSQLFPGSQYRPKGCYIWGGVGRGKTWLMDLFYHSLNISEKQRLHFNQFMQAVHEKLHRLAPCADPLPNVGAAIASEYRVLCLDEFHVTDVADAMLLSGLLQELFHRGVVLVTTSNLAPDNLYPYGLQRERFLEAIELIKSNTEVVHLRGDYDHRGGNLGNRPSYFLSTELGDAELRKYLSTIYLEQMQVDGLELCGRNVNVQFVADGCVWFDFANICGDGRSTSDYIVIAKQFDCVVVTNVPVLKENLEDMARRFISLVDVLYDSGCHVVIGADVIPQRLYQGRMLRWEFQRTTSRLQQIAHRELAG